MSFDLTVRLMEAVSATAAGATTMLAVDGPDDVEVIRRWTESTGNSILTVHPDGVEVVRGRLADPIEALPPERRPGHRLWIYTNFHCNLACDYCCVASSPTADRRVIDLEQFAAIIDEAAAAASRTCT